MRYGQQLASQPQRENLTLVMDLVTPEFGNKGKKGGDVQSRLAFEYEVEM